MGNRRWLIWFLYNLAWTAALIVPIPDPIGESVDHFTLGRKFLLGKSLHVCAYALFAIVTGWVRAPLRHRWLLIAFLMAHGTATELIQQYCSSRSGRLEDVGLDNLGVMLGVLLSWKWWTAE